MKIRTLHYLEGAREASGTAVVIDVFRAFSTACYIAAKGADRIIVTEHAEEAYACKQKHPEYLLAGERGGFTLEGFDFGNSPSAAEQRDFTGSTVVLTTSAGTKGLAEAARHADAVITGSFVNASAAAQWILKRNPHEVSLVCMGWNGREPADEDVLYARYLEGLLTGNPLPFEPMKEFLRHHSKTSSFRTVLDPDSLPEGDFDLCLDLDRFPFVLQFTDGCLIPLHP